MSSDAWAPSYFCFLPHSRGVKPVLLVDVDGVITVFGPGIHDGPERSPLGGLDLALDKDLRPSEPAGRRPQQHLAGVRHHHL